MKPTLSTRRLASGLIGGTLIIALGGFAVVANAESEKKSTADCFASGEDGGWTHPFGNPQPPAKDIATAGFNTVIEIPQESFTKYEIDAKTGSVIVDRFQSMPVAYPGNYGSISQSSGGDGDPLDALVMTREPIAPGAVIRVKAIGVLKMIDGGERDDKIIAVPTNDVDPDYTETSTIGDLPKVEAERIEAFFRVYKDLPAGRKKVELNGYEPARKAQSDVSKAIGKYQKACA